MSASLKQLLRVYNAAVNLTLVKPSKTLSEMPDFTLKFGSLNLSKRFSVTELAYFAPKKVHTKGKRA